MSMIRYEKTAMEGVFLAHSNPLGDERGSFARFFCNVIHQQETGQSFIPVQMNRSFSPIKGTLRGLHYQKPPAAAEGKYIRCIKGRVYDVIVDMRAGSKTFLKYLATELSADTPTALVVPPGMAHGFLTLEDNCEMLYMTDAAYVRECDDGVRFDDPAIGIKWPAAPVVISDRDKATPYLAADFKGVAF